MVFTHQPKYEEETHTWTLSQRQTTALSPPHLLNTHIGVYSHLWAKVTAVVSTPFPNFVRSRAVSNIHTESEREREIDRGTEDTSAGWQRKLGADWTSTALDSKTHLLGRF